jgi:4-amino-4-deoxy-L-arabinose transferase-like glycosyltransferase
MTLASDASAANPFEKRDAYALLALCVLCLVLFCFRLGGHPLWDVDEGLHASTSKDMVLTGDWVTTRFNGQNFYDKTVLFNWFVSLSFLVFGFTEFAARFPAAMLGLGTVIVTFLLGRRMLGTRAGLLAGVILATSPEFLVLSRSVVHDISLAFFISLALALFFFSYRSRRYRTMLLMLFYASLGAAVLAKGPIGLVLPGLIITLFLLLRGRLNFMNEMSLGPGILIFLAVAAPWYVLISLRNEDYVRYFFLQQNLGNFLSKTQAHHPQPFYYYVPVILGGMLPWSFFLPLALFRSFRHGLAKVSDGTLFLLLWFSVIFLFFSAARSKLETYLLPSFPAVALLVAGVWNSLFAGADARERRNAIWSLAPLAALFVGTTTFIELRHPSFTKMEGQYGIGLHDLSVFLIVVTIILAASLILLLVRMHRASFFALAATFSVGLLVALVIIIPRADPFRSTKKLAQEMDRMLPPGEKLTFFWDIKDTALFYTDRRAAVLYTEKGLLDHLSSDPASLCIIERNEYERLPRIVAASSIVDTEGNKLLITGRGLRHAGSVGPLHDRLVMSPWRSQGSGLASLGRSTEDTAFPGR